MTNEKENKMKKQELTDEEMEMVTGGVKRVNVLDDGRKIQGTIEKPEEINNFPGLSAVTKK